MANGPDFSTLESAFNIPAGSTDLSKPANIRKTETAIVKRTDELVSNFQKMEELDIINDNNIDIAEQVARGKEYLRRRAIMMYESVTECLDMLRSELMPGAPASMWLAYSNLVRAANECHGKIEGIYNKLGDEMIFIGSGNGESDEDSRDDGIVTDIETIMGLIETSVRDSKKIDISEVIEISGDGEIVD